MTYAATPEPGALDAVAASPTPSDTPPSLFAGKTTAGLGTGPGRCRGPGYRVMALDGGDMDGGLETVLEYALKA